VDSKDRLIIAMGDELLRMSRHLSKLAEKDMSDAFPVRDVPIDRIPRVRDVIPPKDFNAAVRLMLESVGEDPKRAGLVETPERVRKAWEEMLSGYKVDVQGLFKVFEEPKADEMVIVKNIAFTSMCEHHLLPFDGVAHVGYIPAGHVVGISKLARVVEAYAKRFQVQERLTYQVTAALDKYIPECKGSACKIEATHFCMACRGVRQPGATTITNSLTGVFRKPEVRQEFFSCVGG
jgi:GTP cyclohydrolase I